MKILFATPELAPWVKTGGLGDVAAALPSALRRLGLDVRILLPRYPALEAAFPDAPVIAVPDQLGIDAPPSSLRAATTAGGSPLLLLECNNYFRREGNPYQQPGSVDWPDNHLRFGLLSRVAAWLGSEASPPDLRCDIVHCNDWQTGLAPAYLHWLPGGRSRSVITVHNLSFQGLFNRNAHGDVGLPAAAWSVDGVEYYGQLSFLKAGLQYSDAVVTVSPTYALEILTDAAGMGLAGLLRHRADRLSGILNGIDNEIWNPASDPLIAQPYDARTLAAKAENKRELQGQLGLPQRADIPLLGVVSRLTWQKGLDLLPPIMATLAAQPVQLAVLGSGNPDLEQMYVSLAQKHPECCATRIGFDEQLAHRIEAGADIFVMPSRFEPCGLNQMYSLRYGTPPIVRNTGGLADTVADGRTGFAFDEPSSEALLAAILRAISAWRDRDGWQRIQCAGMAVDHGWEGPAQAYARVYEGLSAAG